MIAYEVEVEFLGDVNYYYNDSLEWAERYARDINNVQPEQFWWGSAKRKATVRAIKLAPGQHIHPTGIEGEGEWKYVDEESDIKEQESAKLFIEFIERIVGSRDRQDALHYVYYATNGVLWAYRNNKLKLKEKELLWELINKMK